LFLGFGDVIPQHPKYLVAMFSLILTGLALVTVCINVVQEKISLVYMRILNRMLEQFMRAQEEGDPEALKGFVEGFNSQAKFLMPLISKNESAKVMKRFKAEAKARGIELPAALTDVDPKTGKPAFCSADATGNIGKSEIKVCNQFESRRICRTKKARSPGRAQHPCLSTKFLWNPNHAVPWP
jgi:hypothetical protein